MPSGPAACGKPSQRDATGPEEDQSATMLPKDIHPAALPPRQLLAECQMRRLRRGGPGGQHRNKVETAVVLVHLPTGVQAEANERRSQAANRSEALRRLRANLALAIRRPLTPGGCPSDAWRARCTPGGAIRIRPDHEDFPILLAEALDVIAACDNDLHRAADTLGCTVSQLVKFVQKEPRAMTRINQQRQSRGQSPLK